MAATVGPPPATTPSDRNPAVTSPLPDVEDWPTDSAAVGVSTKRRTRAIHGPIDHVHPLASVTKPLAAYAVLVAVAEGHLDLDGPAGPEGSTVAHLLAHASGLPPDAKGPTTGVGRKRIYSNLGFDVLGEVLEGAVGKPFSAWLDTAVLQPLGMASTTLEGSPAKDGRGTVRDLLAFGRELLVPTLIPAELHARATSPFLPDLAGVLPGHGRQDPNPWGLGFEIRDDKQPHWTGPNANPRTFGHFGQTGSFLWVDPDAGLACACLTGVDFGDWAREAWPPFNQRVLDHFTSTT